MKKGYASLLIAVLSCFIVKVIMALYVANITVNNMPADPIYLEIRRIALEILLVVLIWKALSSWYESRMKNNQPDLMDDDDDGRFEEKDREIWKEIQSAQREKEQMNQ